MSYEKNSARLHMIVRGRVQGVFFRHSTMEQARGLGLAGWVANLASGEVEIVAEGDCAKLEALCLWANCGPLHANVENVESRWEEFRNEFGGFRIR